MILLLFILAQDFDFEHLYHSATILEVQFQEEKDSAFAKFVELAQDSLFADTTMNFLISKFDTKHGRERHGLKDIFIEIGEPAVPYITAKFDYRGSDEQSRALKQCLWVLGEIGGTTYVDAVGELIHDEQWQVRSGAYATLGKSESPDVLPYILPGLSDTDPSARKSAYYALITIAANKEMDVLIRGLGDPFYGVRYAAVKGLASLGDTVIEPLLKEFGADAHKDFFIARVLAAFDTLDIDWSCVYEHPSPPVRFAFYDACTDTACLHKAQGQETDERLRAYLARKIMQFSHE